MVPVNVSNLGFLSITYFKDDSYVGVFYVSLSLDLIFLDSALIYTWLSRD